MLFSLLIMLRSLTFMYVLDIMGDSGESLASGTAPGTTCCDLQNPDNYTPTTSFKLTRYWDNCSLLSHSLTPERARTAQEAISP